MTDSLTLTSWTLYLTIFSTQVTHSYQTLPSPTDAFLQNINYSLKSRQITPLLHFPHVENTLLPNKIGWWICHDLIWINRSCEFYSIISSLLLLSIVPKMVTHLSSSKSLFTSFHSSIMQILRNLTSSTWRNTKQANSSDTLLITNPVHLV